LVLSALALAYTPIAHAQDDEARSLFAEGVSAYDREDHETALRLFRQSYTLRESQAVLFNIAMTERALGQDQRALADLHEFLGNDDGHNAERSAEARAVIVDLGPRLCTLRLVREPPELEARVDGDPVEMTPSGILVLRPGRYSLSFHSAGFATQTREISLAAGSDETIRVDLEAARDEPQAAEGGGLLFTWIAGGLAVGFGGLAIGAWLAGDAEHRRLADECAPHCSYDALSTLRFWDGLTTVGLVGAGAMTAAAITLGLVEGGVFSGGDDDAVTFGPTGFRYRRRF